MNALFLFTCLTLYISGRDDFNRYSIPEKNQEDGIEEDEDDEYNSDEDDVSLIQIDTFMICPECLY